MTLKDQIYEDTFRAQSDYQTNASVETRKPTFVENTVYAQCAC